MEDFNNKCFFEKRGHLEELRNEHGYVSPLVDEDDSSHDKKQCNEKHHKHEECCCGHHHEHEHEHKHEECRCGHHHEHEHEHKHEECCCGHHHEHEHHHKHEECCCGHHHEHHDGCGCGHNHSHGKKERLILLSRVAFSLITLIVAFFIKDILAQSILLWMAYIVIAYDILFSAVKNIFKGKLFDENFLMSLASLTALIVFMVNKDAGIDGFDGVLVILLYQVGEFFQHLAADKSKESITKMLELDVDKVIKLEGEKQIEIEAKDVKIGDFLLVKPGETIPTDAMIVSGSTSLNTSSLTGESKPLFASKNDKVLSGYINNDGVITIKALTTVDNSTSEKVKKLIDEASKNRAKGERFITKFAKIYTPIVIALALIVAFVFPAILGFNKYFIEYLYKGLTIMVISCPCALVISIPLSYFMGLGKAAKNAILIKGASYLESLSGVSCIAFDKTGTLTKGNFKVANIVSQNQDLMKSLLLTCEQNFTHPIAKSITSYLIDNTNVLEVSDISNLPGLGIKAKYNDKEVLIGNYKLLNDNGIEVSLVEEIGTLIYVGYDGKYLGYILIVDEIKEDAKESLERLVRRYKLALISGDSKEIALKVATDLCIEDVYYEVLPNEKLEVVNKIKETSKVAYVGDGINDAACLLASNVGIAMKSLGSDIAINASDIVIMDDKINSVNKAIAISKKTMNIVKQNIVGSILVKVLVMVLAMFIKIPMFVAIIADVGVCLLAILNSLRIMYGKLHK